MKMEPIEGSETSAIRIKTPGNYPKENMLHLVSWLLYDNGNVIDDPGSLTCRHFCIQQQVFYDLEIAVLLLLNTNIWLINEIPSYLIASRR